MARIECTEIQLQMLKLTICSTDVGVLTHVVSRLKQLIPGCDAQLLTPKQKYYIAPSKLQNRDHEIGLQITRELMADGWEPLNFDINTTSYWFKLVKRIP